MKEPNLLYHYTSLCTLAKILLGMETQNGNKKIFLRAGNAKNMNDPNDCYYFVNKIGNIVGANSKEIDEILDKKYELDAPYILSLSEKADDLHMWTCYGDDGCGVSIAFKNEELDNVASDFHNDIHHDTKLYKCIYDTCSKELYLKIGSPTKENLLSADYWTNGIQESTLRISDIIKHPCYEYEKEWRMVVLHGKNELIVKNQDESKYKSLEDAFYIPIPISCIDHICIGPSAVNYSAIKNSILKCLPDVEVKKSEIPYRSKK